MMCSSRAGTAGTSASGITPRENRSTIVSALSPGAPVTIPRHSIRFVVTEHGVADLLGLTLRERTRALARLADPAFREELERAAAGPSPAPRPA